LRTRRRQQSEDDRLVCAVRRLQPAELHRRRARQSARRAECAYTRYEIHFNEPEFSAFAASGWSLGLNVPDEGRPGRLPVGSIAVKAAWRPLTAADPPAARARYYVERAEIVDVARTLAGGHAVCSESDVALVGLHIAIKTRSRPQWI
jgi:hypothetical protein